MSVISLLFALNMQTTAALPAEEIKTTPVEPPTISKSCGGDLNIKNICQPVCDAIFSDISDPEEAEKQVRKMGCDEICQCVCSPICDSFGFVSG